MASALASSKAFSKSRKTAIEAPLFMYVRTSIIHSVVPTPSVKANWRGCSGPVFHCSLFSTILSAVLSKQLMREIVLKELGSFGLGVGWISCDCQLFGLICFLSVKFAR